MTAFKVSLPHTCEIKIKVEAESPIEALKKALDWMKTAGDEQIGMHIQTLLPNKHKTPTTEIIK